MHDLFPEQSLESLVTRLSTARHAIHAFLNHNIPVDSIIERRDMYIAQIIRYDPNHTSIPEPPENYYYYEGWTPDGLLNTTT